MGCLMRGLLLAVLLLLLVVPTAAKEAAFKACTHDSLTVTFKVGLVDDVTTAVKDEIQQTFTLLASHMDVETLRSSEAFQVFWSLLSEAAQKAIDTDNIQRPVTDGTMCRVA
jgi:hypothetical protein